MYEEQKCACILPVSQEKDVYTIVLPIMLKTKNNHYLNFLIINYYMLHKWLPKASNFHFMNCRNILSKILKSNNLQIILFCLYNILNDHINIFTSYIYKEKPVMVWDVSKTWLMLDNHVFNTTEIDYTQLRTITPNFAKS